MGRARAINRGVGSDGEYLFGDWLAYDRAERTRQKERLEERRKTKKLAGDH